MFGGSQYRLSPVAFSRAFMPEKDTMEFEVGVGYDDRSISPEIIMPKSTIMLSAQGDWGICPLTGIKYSKVDAFDGKVLTFGYAAFTLFFS